MITSIVFISIILSAHAAENCSQVDTNYGQIKGFVGKSADGKDFCTFHNIPFAKPPIGELRLKGPEKPTPWEGIRNGVQEHSKCPQSAVNLETMNISKFVGQEDCLYLSVFAPKTTDNHVPVMVFIHGGGFNAGVGTTYDGRDLVDDGVLLVSINYRLGVLGFLSTEDEVIPGNIGMQDQVFALKWVQENIKYFGGDPNQVTIFGESAGAAAVHFHILSPASKGLFNRAILQSGNVLLPLAHSYGHRGIALQFGAAVGCFTSAEIGKRQSLRLLDCLQQLDAETLTNAVSNFMSWGIMPVNFNLYADGQFLPDESETLLRNGDFNPVDIIIGVNKDEGGLMTMGLFTGDLLEKLVNNFRHHGPVSIGLSYEENAEELSRKVYDHYLNRETIDVENVEEINQLYGDCHFKVATDIVAQMHTGKVYLYEFEYQGQNSFRSVFKSDFGKDWVTHADELIYLFPIKLIEKFFGMGLKATPLDSDDEKMKDIMTKMWTNFAISGNPTPDDSLDFKWESFNKDDPKHLVIDLQPKMQDFPRTEVDEFWTSLPTRENQLLYG